MGAAMSHTDRLLAIVLELQAHRWRRAEDLACSLETSKRTIYRDLVALGQAGVPIVSTPGRGYTLVEGYFLPPVSFTADEATILSLGVDVMARSFDRQYQAAAQSAASKITAALPERLREDVEDLRERIRVGPERVALRPEVETTLRTLRGAVVACQRVRFHYYARFPNQNPDQNANQPTRRATSGGKRAPEHPAGRPADGASWREADPYALTRIGDVWYLHAYCHLRRDRRNFRLDRIEDLAVLDQTFARPTSLPAYSRRPELGPGVDARILFDAQAARWAREAPSFFTIAEEETADGGLLVTLRMRQEEDVVQWLLGWGSHARVLEPPSLRQRIADEAAALLSLYRPAAHPTSE